MTKHTVSAAATGLPVQPIDQIDGALDLLRTSYLALNAPGYLDDAAIGSVASTLDRAIRDLSSVHAFLNNLGAAIPASVTATKDPFLSLVLQLQGLQAAAHMVRHDDDAKRDAIMEQTKQQERKMAETPPTTLEGAVEGLRFLRNDLLEKADSPENLHHFDKLQLSILKAAVTIFERVTPKPVADEFDPFRPLLARYLLHWDACPNETLGSAAELAWNDETTRLEAKLCEVMPTTKAGAIEAIRFVASRAPGQRCEALECQHPLLTAAADILMA